MPKLPHDKNSCQIKGCPYHDTVVRKLVDQIRENQKSMPKLPQHIEVLFDKEFWDSNLNRVTVHDRDPDDIKSFIATIVEEERERIIARFKDEHLGDDYHGEAIEDIIRKMYELSI